MKDRVSAATGSVDGGQVEAGGCTRCVREGTTSYSGLGEVTGALGVWQGVRFGHEWQARVRSLPAQCEAKCGKKERKRKIQE